jgi:hypothetical protein
MLKLRAIKKEEHVAFEDNMLAKTNKKGIVFIRLKKESLVNGNPVNVSANFFLNLFEGDASEITEKLSDADLKSAINAHFPNGYRIQRVESFSPFSEKSTPVTNRETGELILKYGQPYFIQYNLRDLNVEDILLKETVASIDAEAVI